MRLLRYLSSLPALVYISQFMVFIIALVASYFKLVKEDDHGKQVRSRWRVPRPTGPGKAALTALVVSLMFSLLLTFGSSEKSRESETKAEAAQLKLKEQLTQARKENSGLNRQLRELTLEKFTELFEDQNRKHGEYLNRFSGVLRKQESNEQRMAAGINRLLTPITSDIELSFMVEIPSGQRTVDPLIERLRQEKSPLISHELSPSDGSFPRLGLEQEDELRHLFGLMEIRAYFVKGAIDLQRFKDVPEESPGGFHLSPISRPRDLRLSAQFNVEKILTQGQPGNKPRVLLEVETSDLDRPDRQRFIVLEVWNLNPDRVDASLRASSFLDLTGYSIVVIFPIGSYNTAFYLRWLTIRSGSGKTLEIKRFKRYYYYSEPYFIGRID